MNKKSISTILLFAAVTIMPTLARADNYTFTASIPETVISNIGNELTPVSGFDILTLPAFNTSGVLATDGPAFSVSPIFASFFVGPNCTTCASVSSTFTESLTLNGVTTSFLVPYTWSSTGPVDSIQIGAASVAFDQGNGVDIVVTEEGFGLTSANGEILAPVTYDFVATPEPASLMLFGSGLFGLAGLIRRKLKVA